MAFSLLLGDESHMIEIIHRRPHLLLRLNGRHYRVETTGTERDGPQALMIDGHAVTITRAADHGRVILRMDGQSHVVTLADQDGDDGAGHSLSELRAPMPGAVIGLYMAVGDAVTANSPLITIESMKLQTTLGAPRDGIVAEINVAEGELFGMDQVLIRLEDEGLADA